MIKKNLLKLLGVGLLALTLFACSKPTTVVEATTTAKAETEAPVEKVETTEAPKVEKNITIVVSQDLKELYNKKALPIKSAKNVRQLGGYVTKDGKKVKEGVLIRGGHLAKISDEDIQKLKNDYNLKEIIDFRVEEEREPAKDRDIEGVNNTWIVVTKAEPIMDKLENVSEDRDINLMTTYYKYNGGIDSMYSHLVNDEIAQKGFRKFFDILLSNGGATYWHCSTGKDRTGFGAALLLSLLGVDEKTILDDYEASIIVKEKQMNAAINDLKQKGYSDSDIEEIVSLIGVKRSAMENALREIDNKYGGMDAYLHNQIGLTDEEIKTLKDKYLE